MKTFTPKTLISYLLKEFLLSIFIFILIFFSLALITSYIEDIIFFKNQSSESNFFIKIFLLTLVKTPTLLIQFCPFIFLFASIFYFAKLNKLNEISSMNLSGLSNNFIFLVPSIFSIFLGMLIISIITPLSSEMLKFYESEKQKYSKNDNLIILNKTGLWIKSNYKNNKFIIRADKVETQDFTKLKNITIYKFNNTNNFKQRIDSKSALIKNKMWFLSNANIINDNGENQKKNIVYESNINFDELKNFFQNASTYSVWNIKEKISSLQQTGYYGEDLIIMYQKYISLPLLLYCMVFLASIFTIKSNYNFNNFIYTFIAIITGIIIYYLGDLSIALGKSGKIPIIISVWIPIIIIMTFSIYSLIRDDG